MFFFIRIRGGEDALRISNEHPVHFLGLNPGLRSDWTTLCPLDYSRTTQPLTRYKSQDIISLTEFS
jgi:hypothetical protein